MKPKIISSILISSLLIQISLTSGGCMTFRPLEDNYLSSHKKDGYTLLIKLKDKREIKVEPENLFYYGNDSLIIYGDGDEFNLADSTSRGLKKFKGFISPAKIDSEQIIMVENTKYHIFWMIDKKRISVMDRNLGRFNSDTHKYYWIAKSINMGYQQIYPDDIAGLEEKDKITAGGYFYYGLLLATIALSIAVFSTWPKN